MRLECPHAWLVRKGWYHLLQHHRVKPVHPVRHGMAYGMNAMIAFQIGTVRLDLNAYGALNPLNLPMGHHLARSVKQERTTVNQMAGPNAHPALLEHSR